jgi:hypothetical protein
MQSMLRQDVVLQRPPSTVVEYRALLARRGELNNQLSEAQSRRGQLSDQLRQMTTEAKVLGITPDAEATGALRTQLSSQDARIARLQQQLDATNDQIANASPEVMAAARPGGQAITLMPPVGDRMADRFAEKIIPLAGMFSVFFLLPIALAFARLIWKRASVSPATPALSDAQAAQRFQQLQQSVDAIAVEVERISEGQRYTAKILSEKERPGLRA